MVEKENRIVPQCLQTIKPYNDYDLVIIGSRIHCQPTTIKRSVCASSLKPPNQTAGAFQLLFYPTRLFISKIGRQMDSTINRTTTAMTRIMIGSSMAIMLMIDD